MLPKFAPSLGSQIMYLLPGKAADWYKGWINVDKGNMRDVALILQM
jgi:hypothetical protein